MTVDPQHIAGAAVTVVRHTAVAVVVIVDLSGGNGRVGAHGRIEDVDLAAGPFDLAQFEHAPPRRAAGKNGVALPADDKDANNDESFGELFTRVNYKFWFSRCPYDKYNRYRTRSMIYNSEDQNNTINELRLREFFLVFHLVDWNLTDDEGKKIELKFDPNKALSDESLKLIYTLPNTLLDVVLSTYEKKMSL